MGKPRDIGIRENSVNQLKLAQTLIEDHIKGDSNLEVVITLIKTTLTHLSMFPKECEFRDDCEYNFLDNYVFEPEEPMRDESRD